MIMATRLLICLLLVTCVWADISTLHRARRAVPHSYIVKLKNGIDVDSVVGQLTLDATLRGSEVIFQDTFRDVFHGFTAKLSEKALEYIRGLEAVDYVSENGLINLPISQAGNRLSRFDQRGSTSLWFLDRIDQRYLPLDGKFNPPNQGDQAEIWVFDTGIRATHDEFRGRSVSIGYDVDGGKVWGVDPWGHGTLCTSVAAGNVYGVAKQAKIVVAKVISSSSGMGTWAAVIKGLDVMAKSAQKPAVASISLGQDGHNQVLEDAVISAMDKGFTVAVAAGNENNDACASYPSNFKRVITVGASTVTDRRWAYSNYGQCVDIFAPGKDITGAYIGSDYDTETVSGTSEATPIVAGAAAILLSSQWDLTHDQVKAKLLNDATPNVLVGPLPAGSPNLLLYV